MFQFSSTTKAAAAVLSLLLAQPVTAQVEHSVGIARSDKTGEIHYVEHHQYFDDGNHRIDYYTPALSTMVVKELSYPALPQHPRIEQRDLVNNTRLLVEPLEDRLRMVTIEGDDREENFVDLGPDVVCDAGFDTYIKSTWQSLLDRGKTTVDFAVAGRSSTVAMEIKAYPIDGATTGFDITAKNFLVRMFLPKIELQYRNDDRKLMQYHGLSNLTAQGGDRKVTISFAHYETEQRLQQPLATWLPDDVAGGQMTAATGYE